jgi:hypothetical protein
MEEQLAGEPEWACHYDCDLEACDADRDADERYDAMIDDDYEGRRVCQTRYCDDS